MDVIYIAFNKRSCVTAKELRDKFSSEGVEARLINSKKFKKKPNVLIRIGNSYKEAPEGCIEVNSIESVKLASNKLLMAYHLIRKEGVNFPKAHITLESKAVLDDIFGSSNTLHGFSISDGLDLYYRNSANIVRRRRGFIAGDLYATEPISRAREFRVHVFGGKTIGVYEKIPVNDEGEEVGHENVLYCKNDNCTFRRIDTSDDEQRRSIKGVRPMAVLAVQALGLTFGGADVIISTDGEIFVNEVNSAPSLNSLNIDRYYEKIKEYIEEKKNGNQD